MKTRQLTKKIQTTVDLELNQGVRQYLKLMGDDIGVNEHMKKEMIDDWKDYCARMNEIQKLVKVEEDDFEIQLNITLMNLNTI